MRTLLINIIIVFSLGCSLPLFGQTVTIYLNSSGGSFTGEKWMNITTGVNGTGTVIWSQGANIGDNDGLLTDEAITLNCGTTYFLNAYDQYDDSWDGSTYILSENTGGAGTVYANNGGVSPDDGSDTDASGSWDQTSAELESSESFSVPCPCAPGIGTATAVTTNCNVNGTFDVQLTINDAGTGGGSVTVSDGTANPDQVVSSFPTTVTFTGYASGSSVTLNADNGTCDLDANVVSHTCTCTTPTIGTATVDATNCGGAGTFDVNLTISAAGMGSSVTVSDGTSSQVVSSFPSTVTFTGYSAGTSVTLNAANFFCDIDANTVTEACTPGTSCANAIAITDGYTSTGNTTPGTGGAENWVTSAVTSCGTASATGFADSDVILYSYTTGANAGEAFYFTIDHNNSGDGDHQLGVFTSCSGGVLSGCVESTYDVLDDIVGVCASSLSANTTYYIGVSKRNPSLHGEALNYDVIDFIVETSTTIPDDECASAPFLSSLVDYNGSTRCNYTVSTGSPSVCGVSVDNDSWVSFIASDPFVSIDYTVTNCSNNDGIQLNVFSGTCGSLTEISGSCINPTGNNVTGVWNFSGLTPGDTYYIRADGYAGDLCDYRYNPTTGVLPVRLVSFHGKEVSSGYNRIEWVTASEINANHFVVEYSYDGVNFNELAVIDSKGHSAHQNNYYTYHEPKQKKTYYRLIQVDTDGDQELSKVISILNDQVNDPGLIVYPNPTSNGQVNIQSENINQVQFIEVYNSIGKLVKRVEDESLDSEVSIDIDLSSFGTGIYYLKVQGDYQTYTHKLIYKK